MIAWALILFLAGIVLLLAEFIVPGLVCGILGGVLIVVSGAMACIAHPQYTLMIVLGLLIAVFACIIAGMYMLSRTRAGDRLIVSASQNAEAGWETFLECRDELASR